MYTETSPVIFWSQYRYIFVRYTLKVFVLFTGAYIDLYQMAKGQPWVTFVVLHDGRVGWGGEGLEMEGMGAGWIQFRQADRASGFINYCIAYIALKQNNMEVH